MRQVKRGQLIGTNGTIKRDCSTQGHAWYVSDFSSFRTCWDCGETHFGGELIVEGRTGGGS